jgi:hypothetical protein
VRRGRVNVSRMSGSGSTPDKVPMAASIPGDATGTPAQCRFPKRAAVSVARVTSLLIQEAPSTDLTGNVWQLTNEYSDEHTRAGILRGGSYYQPQGSRWYFPQSYKLNEHGKLLLMPPAKDRSGTLGFRWVIDAK